MRRALPIAAAVLILALAAYTGYWFYSAHRLRDGLAPWAAAQQKAGYDITWQSVAVEGFPFAFRLRFADAALAAQRPLPYRLTSPALHLAAAPWDIEDWHVTAPQGATLATPAAASLTTGAIEGTIATAGGGARIALHAAGLTGGGLAQGLAVDAADAQVTLPAHPPASHTDPALSLSLTLNQTTLPTSPPGFGRKIATLALAATLDGRLPGGPLDRALAAWRDDGGTLVLQTAHLVWDDLDATVTGTLALDNDLQPIGSLSATIAHPDALIDAAVATGMLKERFAGVIKTVLAALAHPAANGQPVVTAPITLQEGQVFLGPAAVARLPHLTWK